METFPRGAMGIFMELQYLTSFRGGYRVTIDHGPRHVSGIGD